ncbi:MAG: DEAD/DEAH box helicase family protein [Lachnospiraceae bacterium]|nr:DEAD/DEAH box helicase family protein [Lachnospiraceae bacterium]
MSQEFKATITKRELFHPLYPKALMNFHEMPRGYVSDIISNQELENWTQWKHLRPITPPRPVFITAQTGAGKNYFITHNLREYAKRNGERILYVSNRVALDYQQKLELAQLTHTKLPWNPNTTTWENMEAFENVTVLTYHKLAEYLRDKDSAWFDSFGYVVLDECHFFYRDAFFNEKTWYILKRIPQKFRFSVRIYMSATLEDVFEPIRYVEELKQTGECKPFPNSYRFPLDYSSYTSFFFSSLTQIEKLIKQEIQSREISRSAGTSPVN